MNLTIEQQLLVCFARYIYDLLAEICEKIKLNKYFARIICRTSCFNKPNPCDRLPDLTLIDRVIELWWMHVPDQLDHNHCLTSPLLFCVAFLCL